jgi:hypothetical protein
MPKGTHDGNCQELKQFATVLEASVIPPVGDRSTTLEEVSNHKNQPCIGGILRVNLVAIF